MEDAMEKLKIGNQSPEEIPFSEKVLEKGRNVHITIKFIRHGLRTPVVGKTGGELTEYGRGVTRENARESGLKGDDFDAVKAFGSTAKEELSTAQPRSLETADIYATEITKIASGKKLKTRGRDVLNYQTLVSPIPYDHDEIYNRIYKENLPNPDNSTDEDKAKASKAAQAAVLNHSMALQTPEAINYRKEIAGAFSYFIDTYIKMSQRLKSGSKVLIPAGTHGGSMEPFLQQILVRRFSDGTEIHGFEKVEEIGGEFDSSEAFNVEVATDDKGSLQKIKVIFDNKDRPRDEMYLDIEKIQELKDFYISLHPKNK